MRSVSVPTLFLSLLLLSPGIIHAAANPTITGVSPSSPSNLINTVFGSGFEPGAQLFIGGVAPSALWQGGTQFLVFQAPSTGSGAVNVKVVNPDGGTATLAGGFTYGRRAATPVIRGVAPALNSTVLKAVWGSNFDSGAQVFVNGVVAQSTWQVGSEYIVFQPPANTPLGSAVDVKVVNPGGESGDLSVVLASPGGTGTTTPTTGVPPVTTPPGGTVPNPPTTLPTPAACTKYVSQSGSVNGNTAYTTIQTGVNALVPGDSLCIAAGTYHEVVNVTTAGTASRPITIRALNLNDKPVIDGAYNIPGGTPGNSSLDKDGGQVTCSEYSQDPTAGLGPYPKQACFSWSSLVNIAASYVTWDSVDITRSRGAGLIIGVNHSSGQTYSNINVYRSEIGYARNNGVLTYNGINISFDGNQIHDAGNYLATAKRGPMDWGGGMYNGYTTGMTIAGNTIYHNWGLNLYLDVVDTETVEHNVFYHTSDSTYFRTGFPSADVIFDSENGRPVSHVIFADNIMSGGSTLLGFWQFDSASTYTDFQIYNNTLMNPGPSTNTGFGGNAAIFSDMTNLTGFKFMNNIIYAPTGTVGTFVSIPGMQFSNNLWSSAPPTNMQGSNDIITGSPGLANPGFVPTPGNFDTSSIKLQVTSPAIRSGANIPLVTDDFFGTARPSGAYDIGAYQSGR